MGTHVADRDDSVEATGHCILAGCAQRPADDWTQTCDTHFTRYEKVKENNTGSAFRYPCGACQRTRWFNGESGRCECCGRGARPAGVDEIEQHLCVDCELPINSYNTSTNVAYKGRKRVRCGRCYLKWKAAERAKRGEK